MGGMFIVVKVRAPERLAEPWHTHPPRTVASRASLDELARDGIKV